jgi:GNAT superfamily N-acetyltransferase
MHQKPLLRLAEASDVPAINELTARSIRALHEGIYGQEIIDESIRHAYGVDWQLIVDRTYFVAMSGGSIAGAGGWSFRHTIAGAHGPHDPPAALLDAVSNAARMRAFYIDPAYARSGIGSLILNQSEQAAVRAGFFDAELTSTLPAVPFYAALGYQVEQDFALKLPSGSHLKLILMKKNLLGEGYAHEV